MLGVGLTDSNVDVSIYKKTSKRKSHVKGDRDLLFCVYFTLKQFRTIQNKNTACNVIQKSSQTYIN